MRAAHVAYVSLFLSMALVFFTKTFEFQMDLFVAFVSYTFMAFSLALTSLRIETAVIAYSFLFYMYPVILPWA